MENIKTDDLKKMFHFKNNQWNYIKDKPCLVDFYTDWCKPCKKLEIILDELSKNYNHLNFYKVNIEDEYELAEIFEIKDLPTTILFTKDKVININGLVSKQKIENHIKSTQLDENLV